jgi:predicted DNA-binding antitoxin AbrB/MazE fold protein
MGKTIKARFSKGVIEPLEKVEIPEGEEITVTIEEITEKAGVLDVTFGAWKETVDCDELIRNIYADRWGIPSWAKDWDEAKEVFYERWKKWNELYGVKADREVKNEKKG